MLATTREQSQKLLRLGLNTETADACWVNDSVCKDILIADTLENVQRRYDEIYDKEGMNAENFVSLLPAWSLDVLLEITRKANATTSLVVFHGRGTHMRCKDNGFIWQKDLHGSSQFQVVFDMICWLLKEGYIK